MSVENLRAAFGAVANGKLHLDHAELSYQGSEQIITLQGRYADGSPFNFVTPPFVGNPVLRAIKAAQEVMGASTPVVLTDKAQTTQSTQGLAQFDRTLAKAVVAVNKETRMGKLHQVAQRAPAVVKALEDRADKLSTRLDALEKKGGGAFDRWDGYLTDQETAVSQAEDAINQLSNGAPSPLPSS